MPDETRSSRPPITADVAQVPAGDAEYTLEYAVQCPHCSQTIKTMYVVRLLRTRVNFTSSLPRRGRVLICPDCRRILSGELSLS